MTFSKSLRMLFSAVLFAVVLVPLATADGPQTTAEKDRVAAASCQRCGDGYCAPSCENERTCPADCRATRLAAPLPAPSTPAPAAAAARCGKCGDGQCVKSCGETALSCPVDCGGGGEPSAAAVAPVPASECTTTPDAAAKPKTGAE
jgi:hypothetical protein